MLDLGWQEFMVIAVVTVLVVGPKEIPRVFRTVTGAMRKVRSLAGEFHSAMDEMAKEADLDDLKKEVNKIKDGSSDWMSEIDPTDEMRGTVEGAKKDLEETKKAVNQAGRMKTDPPIPLGPPKAKQDIPSPSPTTPAPEIHDPTLKAGDPRLLPEARASVINAAKGTDGDDGAETPPKTAAKTGSVKKAASKKTAAKKASAKKSAVKKVTVKKAAVKKTPAKKSSAKKATAKKAASKVPAGAKPVPEDGTNLT